jgi:hypothetical protein
MADIIDFDDIHTSDHFVFKDPLTEEVHVVPKVVIDNWINGSRPITEEHHPVIRSILLDWLLINPDLNS